MTRTRSRLVVLLPIACLLLGSLLPCARARPAVQSTNRNDSREAAQESTGEKDAGAAALERIRALYARLRFAPRDSYLNYAIATIARREGVDLRKEEIRFPLVPVVTDDPARRTDLLALAAGATALHESLQLTEMVGPVRTGSGRTVPLDRLAPPELPILDLARLESERLASGEPEWAGDPGLLEDARRVPRDWIFVRFASGRDLLAVLEEADLWVRHIQVFYGAGRGETRFLWRVFDDLGLPDPRRFPAFYEKLGGPITLTMSDPFLREGTDVTVLLPRGTPAALAGLEEPPEGSASRRRWAVVEGRVLLSTSRAALDRLTTLVPADSLAESSDFHYTCGLLPPRSDLAVVVFLSEGFLERLSGPRLRVLESRRMRCASHMRTIVNARLLHREESRDKAARAQPNDRARTSLEELSRTGYIPASVLRCPQGGTYRLEEIAARNTDGAPIVVPVCTAHGRLDHLRPHIETDLTDVSEEEAGAYRRFARSYAGFWQRAFDPALVTARHEGESWQLDSIMLPPAENSLYRNLARLCGAAPTTGRRSVTTPHTVFSTTIKLEDRLFSDLVTLLRRERLLKKRPAARSWSEESDKMLDSLRDGFAREITLGLLDAPLLLDFDLSLFLAESLRSNSSRDILLAPLLAGSSLPAYLVCPVRDADAAQRFLAALNRGAVRLGGRSRSSRYTLTYQGYELSPSGNREEGASRGADSRGGIHALTFEIFAFELRLFYRLHDSKLFVATRPDVLEQVITQAEPDTDKEPLNLRVSLFPRHWERLRPAMLLDYEEAARYRCLADLITLEPFHRLGLDAQAAALGLTRPCPDGGMRVPGPGDKLTCSVHGLPEAPTQPAAPSPENAVSKLLEGLRRISFSVRFIPEGLHTTVRIER